jgi:hypothetical protein
LENLEQQLRQVVLLPGMRPSDYIPRHELRVQMELALRLQTSLGQYLEVQTVLVRAQTLLMDYTLHQEMLMVLEMETKALMNSRFFTELHYLLEPHLRRQLVYMWHQEELRVKDLRRPEIRLLENIPRQEWQMVPV